MNTQKPFKSTSQQPIPNCWRKTIIEIIESLKNGDYILSKKIDNVNSVSEDDALITKNNIKYYGDDLISLPKESWDTSVCQWNGSYWDALIDLYTKKQGVSDLVLHLKIHENHEDYQYEMYMVYVP